MHNATHNATCNATYNEVLVIEDEPDIGALVAMHMRDLGLIPRQCFDGKSGLQQATQDRWALIVLDLSLPYMDGMDVCRQIRERNIYTPILMLTARGNELDRARGLDVGADDYLSKPFGVVELTARARALLRRARRFNLAIDTAALQTEQRLCLGDLEIDLQRRLARRAGHAIELTAREFDLLAHFALHPGRVFSRAQLLDQVWGATADAYEHAVSSHINRLRAKLEVDPQAPQYLLTVWGVGYRFVRANSQ